MTNIISLLFQFKKTLLVLIIFLGLYFYDTTFREDINKKFGIENVASTNIKNDNAKTSNNSENKNLETNKIYLMYKDKFKVDKAVDGDTIYMRKVLSDGNLENYTYKVRMMAINTLEKDSSNNREKCLANLAQQYTYQNIVGKYVYLYGDTTQPELDQYKRVLAYVLREGDDEFFNDKIMKTGLSKTYKATPPATNWERYENIKLEMEKEKKGIWDSEICKI